MHLEFVNVAKSYSGPARSVAALQDISFKLESGQFAAIQGASGCGKSTLLLVAGGLLRPDSGTVRFDDKNLYDVPANQRAQFRANSIGFVFQQFHLVPYLNVIDNVLAAAVAQDNGSPASMRERAERLIEQFGLTDRSDHVPAALSTGERQRTALARALLNDPQVLLADEPTGNLDDENSEVVLDHLADFASSGGSVLLVTHDQKAAARAHMQWTMVGGKIETTSKQT